MGARGVRYAEDVHIHFGGFMNMKKLFISTLAGGILLNLLDMAMYGGVLQNAMKSVTGMKQDIPVTIYIITDFIMALVFAVVYEALKGSATPGAAKGARFGFFAGLFAAFPAMLAFSTMIVGMPYWMGWVWTVNGIVWYTLLGAVVGFVYEKVK